MLLDRFGQSNKFWKKTYKKCWNIQVEYSEDPLGNVLRTSWGRPESTSQERPLNVRLGRPLNVISGYPQDVKLGRSWDGQIGSLGDVRSGCPRDGQIESLGDVLGMLEGDVLGKSWRPIFAGWAFSL